MNTKTKTKPTPAKEKLVVEHLATRGATIVSEGVSTKETEGDTLTAPITQKPAPPPAVPKAKLVLTKPEYSATYVITYVKPNPKRAGTTAYDNYAKYKVGMTVLSYLTECGIARPLASACVRFDLARGHITVGKKPE